MRREEMIEKVNKELISEDIDTIKIFRLIKDYKTCQLLPSNNEAEIICAACEVFDVNMEDLFSKSRRRELVNTRMFIVKYLYNLGIYPYERIAKLLGRNHTTMIYLKNKSCELIEVDRFFKSKWIEFTELLINNNAVTAIN